MGSRRMAATCLAVTLLIGSCAPKHASPSASSLSQSPESTSGSFGSSTTTARATSDPRRPPATRPAPTKSGSGATTKGQDPIVQASRPGPGGLARLLLGARSQATRVSLDVLAQSGATPRRATLDHLQRVLGDGSGKPVSVVGPTALSGGSHSWSESEIRQLADSAGRAVQGGDQAVLRILFLRGDLNGDRSVIGISVRADVMAVFSDLVAESASPIVSGAEIEDAVSTHETGHLLGLVDLVLHTGRQDPQHPGHSANKGSVMYWAVESDLISEVLGGSPPRDFDSADRADLATMHSGG